MPARALALVAAVAMVVGAVALRARLNDRKQFKDHPPMLVCVPELADLCHSLADKGIANVTSEPAQQTASKLAATNGDKGVDGWLTTKPWPAIAEQLRAGVGKGPFFRTTSPAVLARSPVALAVWPDRERALAATCPAKAVTWKCLGDAARKQTWAAVAGHSEWGLVKAAVPGADNAVGLTVLAAATTDFFGGRTDLSTADLEDPAFRDWLSALANATPARLPDFNAVLAGGPAVEDAYAAVEADLAPELAVSARSDRPRLLYPAPMMTADLVLAAPPGKAGDRLAEAVADAVRSDLPEQGWRVPGKSGTAPSTPALPAGNGLPDPGFLSALAQAWREAA